jgi:hypothetical protein
LICSRGSTFVRCKSKLVPHPSLLAPLSNNDHEIFKLQAVDSSNLLRPRSSLLNSQQRRKARCHLSEARKLRERFQCQLHLSMAIAGFSNRRPRSSLLLLMLWILRVKVRLVLVRFFHATAKEHVRLCPTRHGAHCTVLPIHQEKNPLGRCSMQRRGSTNTIAYQEVYLEQFMIP